MKILTLKDFMKRYILNDNTMNEGEFQRVYNYPIYLRDSKIDSDKGFVNIDNGSQGGTHWTCFLVKHNKSHYFDSFGGQPVKFFLSITQTKNIS